jgi:CRP/FNR family transcriptional regulator, cyclic AMP receptor protein
MPLTNPDILRPIHLFALLDKDELRTLAGELEEVHFLPGQKIFSMGDDGDKMYIVEHGKVELFLPDQADHEVELGFADAGDLFGELSFLSGESHSISAKAVEDTEVIAVDQHDLEMLVRAHPASALEMMSALSRRLRDATQLVQPGAIRDPNAEIARSATFGEKLADLLTGLMGDIRFIGCYALWIFTWIGLNVNIIPGVTPFDPYPFPTLMVFLLLEAAVLVLFVLVGQNRQAVRQKIRSDIDYEVNLRNEAETRVLMQQLESFQQLTLTHLSVLERRLDRLA